MGNEKLGAPFAQNSTVVEFVPNNGVGMGTSMRSSLPSKCRALALTELLVADTSKSYVDSLQSSFKIEIIAVWVVAELGEKVTVNVTELPEESGLGELKLLTLNFALLLVMALIASGAVPVF